MDTTDEYLDMAKTAEKLQEEWRPAVGDHIAVKRDASGMAPKDMCGHHIITAVNHTITMRRDIKDTYKINRDDFPWHGDDRVLKYQMDWLPRQDQLQKMCKYRTVEALHHEFNYFSRHNEYDTYEKMWLAFVMEEKYNMQWNGKAWKQKR